MKYTPSQPPEGINVTPEHPLKSFFILTAGTIGVVILLLVFVGLLADFVVRFIPIKYEQDYFQDKNLGAALVVTDSEAPQEVIRYLQSLADTLHEHAGEEYAEHEFKVTFSSLEEPNAFAAPGGHIVVTKGLLDSVESENGLAMVIAHEIGHHYARHPLRGMGRGLVVTMFLVAISGVDIGGLADRLVEQTTLIGHLAYSRKQESEADDIAVKLLRQKYGHANGASEFFKYIKSSGKHEHAPPVFLSTHPSTEQRLDYLTRIEQENLGSKVALPDTVSKYLSAQ